jgi:NADPH-dependent 2,4-dienoyl-CoA reductase/sulfur reductase-like enzyme/rhodanese-related sulfurtransferase
MSKFIIVGGVAGGATAATRLRRLNERAEIVLFERGEHISFGNCGLPYYIGGSIGEEGKLILQTPKSLNERFNIDVRINAEVVGIDREAKKVKARNLKTNEEYEESYDKLVLSPGAFPFSPPIPGIDSPGVFTLRVIPEATRIKDYIREKNAKSAVIVGAGFIGVELAENLRDLGLEVNLFQLSDQVLPVVDKELVPEVHKTLTKNGVKVFLKNSVEGIAKSSDGRLDLKLKSGTLQTDLVVFSIGVRPDSDLAKNAGLTTNERGGIVVDRRQRTSDENIYAVGDAVEIVDFLTKRKAMIPLAAPANKQARVAADDICGIRSEYLGSIGTSILKVFNLTVATAGINEKTAQSLGLSYDKVFLLAPDHAVYYPGAEYMWIKVVFGKEKGEILGAQIVGPKGVDKRLDVLAVAIRAGLTATDLIALDLAYAPPYSSAKDPVNMVGLMIENLINGLAKQFHWSQVDDLPKDGSCQLLDVRGEDEFLKGHLPGFVNAPLKTLRGGIAKLDPKKPTYVNCEAGLRSYYAARILTQNGFEAYYLSGGYRLYSLIKNDLV